MTDDLVALLQLVKERGSSVCTGACERRIPGELHCFNASQILHISAQGFKNRLLQLVRMGLLDLERVERHDGKVMGQYTLSGIAFVEANGAMAACFNRWPSIGDLKANSFEEIWNGQPHRRIFFSALNHRPVESCVGCRQLQVVDYVRSPGAFVKDGGADPRARSTSAAFVK